MPTKIENGITVELTGQDLIDYNEHQAHYESTKEQEAYTRLRAERNRLLSETDWMASSDLTMTQAWIDYRQALRDLPNTVVDVYNPIYPIKPE